MSVSLASICRDCLHLRIIIIFPQAQRIPAFTKIAYQVHIKDINRYLIYGNLAWICIIAKKSRVIATPHFCFSLPSSVKSVFQVILISSYFAYDEIEHRPKSKQKNRTVIRHISNWRARFKNNFLQFCSYIPNAIKKRSYRQFASYNLSPYVTRHFDITEEFTHLLWAKF